MKRILGMMAFVSLSAVSMAQGYASLKPDSVGNDSISYFLHLDNIMVFGKSKRKFVDDDRLKAIGRANGYRGYSFDFARTMTKVVNYIPFSIMRKFHIPFNDKERNRRIAKKIAAEYDDIDVMQRSYEKRKRYEESKKNGSVK